MEYLSPPAILITANLLVGYYLFTQLSYLATLTVTRLFVYLAAFLVVWLGGYS